MKRLALTLRPLRLTNISLLTPHQLKGADTITLSDWRSEV